MNPPLRLRIGTRGSKLALTQTNLVKNQLQAIVPSLNIEIVHISTTGDKITDAPLAKIGGKGVFTKELESALLENRIDLAVHSMKDLPTELPEGLVVGAVPRRENPLDALISTNKKKFSSLPPGARIGTSSLRRKAQLLCLRSDLVVSDLRGNLDTRLRKLDEGRYDAIVVAVAGLSRLGLAMRIVDPFVPDQMLPAVGQGALGLEIRTDDTETSELVGKLNHVPTQLAVRAERSLLKSLGGGCQFPIGALADAVSDNGMILLRGIVCSEDGVKTVRAEMAGSGDDPESLGAALAKRLLSSGAEDILKRLSNAPNRDAEI